MLYKGRTSSKMCLPSQVEAHDGLSLIPLTARLAKDCSRQHFNEYTVYDCIPTIQTPCPLHASRPRLSWRSGTSSAHDLLLWVETRHLPCDVACSAGPAVLLCYLYMYYSVCYCCTDAPTTLFCTLFRICLGAWSDKRSALTYCLIGLHGCKM